MYCAISGAVPEEPVVSKVSGHLFERRLLEKVVADTGVDPVTKSPMRYPEDAVVVRATGGAASAASGSSGSTAPPKPRPSPAASVPGLIGLFRDEWDALALETHQLRASLHSARQELAHALYQHDAALRVIARLVRERDAARDAYEARAGGGGATASLPSSEQQQQQQQQQQQAEKKEQNQNQPAAKKAKTQGMAPLKQEVVDAITALSEELSKGRKKRVPPAGCATAESVKSFGLLESSPHALHKARTPGVSCVAVAGFGSSSSSLVASGGLDGDVCVFDASTKTTVASFSHAADSKLPAARRAVTDVAFVRRALLASAGADGAVRLWRPTKGEDSDDFLDADDAAAGASSSSSWAVCAEASAASEAASDSPTPSSSSSSSSSSAVVALAVHPSRDYLATAGADGEWRLYDLEKAAATATAAAAARNKGGKSAAPPALLSRLVCVPDAASGGYSSAAFHPDGVILGVGTRGGAVRIWDARSMRAVAKFEGHSPAAAAASASSASSISAGVTGLSFSENGYYLATGAADGVKAWDLRKLKNLASVPGPGGDGGGEEDGSNGGGGVSRLAFDPSGYLLAVAGPGGVSVLGSKQEWAPLCRLQGGEGAGGGTAAAERRKAGALSVAWSSSGDVLFAGGSDNCLRAFGASSPSSA